MESGLAKLTERIYTNKLLALFILRFAHAQDIMKVRLINRAIYTRIDEDIFWLLIYKQLTVLYKHLRVVPNLPSDFMESLDLSQPIWKKIVQDIGQSLKQIHNNPQAVAIFKHEEQVRTGTAASQGNQNVEKTITYNIGAYGTIGKLPKELSELIIENAKYDFLATFNSRFWHKGGLKFLSLVSLPNAKYFSPHALDSFDVMLLMYDPSTEPGLQKNFDEELKEKEPEEVQQQHEKYIEIIQKVKEAKMQSLLLVMNTSVITDDLDKHPIVQAYREAEYEYPVLKIDKFGENTITLLYNYTVHLGEPERVAREDYYKRKLEERMKEQEEKKREQEEGKQEEKKEKEKDERKKHFEVPVKKKCGVF